MTTGPGNAHLERSITRLARRSDPSASLVTHVRLARILNDVFDDEELQEISFELSIDDDNLPGLTKSQRIRSLITFCRRRRRYSELVQLCKSKRPQAFTSTSS